MTDLIAFRLAGHEDLKAIVALLTHDPLGQTREDPAAEWDKYETAFNAIDADPNNQLVIAVRGQEVMGCLQLTFIPGLTYTGGTRAQIEGVRIAEAARGSGLGRQLIEQAVAIAQDKGCVLVQLTSDKRRPEAIAFYEALEFQASHEGFKRWF